MALNNKRQKNSTNHNAEFIGNPMNQLIKQFYLDTTSMANTDISRPPVNVDLCVAHKLTIKWVKQAPHASEEEEEEEERENSRPQSGGFPD